MTVLREFQVLVTVGIQREANRKDIFKGWAGAWDWREKAWFHTCTQRR